ncbi:alpha/beta fold hydrolase [Maribacter algarum]|uniref:Alpha/beta fold hydrolase n=1 Tax=Maribacter algarum (ex Zhang et al. 2020) TaxID=2578118 RepID=A0A5S3PW12_9FLAO|nr:haloalkane dehalogenase [Maribacter algarum]TMM59110.1 alpha/beta fold hydrolase [Maribacter algarum]
MEFVRTPSKRFENLPGFDFKENYVQFQDMQMHYLDEGSGKVILALHGEPSWCFLYRKFIPELESYRFIAPDFFGFGKSDKPTQTKDYSYEFHLKTLTHFCEKLELKDITLVVQDWGGLLGLGLLGQHPDWFKRVVIMNTFLPIGKPLKLPFRIWQWFAKYHPSIPVSGIIKYASYTNLSKEVLSAYDAPFPNKKYKAGARIFPSLVPSKKNDPSVKYLKKAREVLTNWNKPALVLFSDKDKVLGGLEKFFYKLIPTANDQQKIIIKDAGHFLQEEKGEEIARYIDAFIKRELEV